MVEIFLRNIYSNLSENTDERIISELEKRFTVKHPNYWFSPQFRAKVWDGKTHFLKIPSLKFPSGLLFIIEEYCKEINTEYKITDLRGEIPNNNLALIDEFFLKGIELYDYQMVAINKAITTERGVLELPTGSGKTEIAAAIIKALSLKTLFIVHTKDLLYQTIDRFKLRLERDDIGIIGDGKFETEHDIVVSTVQTLNKKLFPGKSEKGKRKKADKKIKEFLNQFQVMFQDECHHSSSASFSKIGMFMHNAIYRYGLSGTALRRDILSNMRVMAITGASIYQLKTTKLIDSGYLSDIEVKIIDNPEIIDKEEKGWQEIYRVGIVQSEARNQKIVDRIEKMYEQKKKIMVLVKHIEHGEILQRMLTDESDIPAIFIWGAHESEEREKIKNEFSVNGDFVLIASPIYDEGIDLPKINVLIIASGGKSEWKTIQKIGRGLRKKSDKSQLIVYDFYDHSKFLKEHSQERIMIYEREGFFDEKVEV